MNFVEMKSETCSDQYEIRSYDSWHKHITLSCLAHAFLTVLRQQFENLPDMSVTYENTMEDLKKRENHSCHQQTEIRRIIADFIYTIPSDFLFRIQYIKWKLQHQLTASVCHWKSHFLQL